MIVIDRKPPCRIVAWHRVLCDNNIARNITLHLTIPKTLKTIESSQNVHCACTNKPRIRLDTIPILKKTNQRNATATIRNWRTCVRVYNTHICKYVCIYTSRTGFALALLWLATTPRKLHTLESKYTREYAHALCHATIPYDMRRGETKQDEMRRDETGRNGTTRDDTGRDETRRYETKRYDTMRHITHQQVVNTYAPDKNVYTTYEWKVQCINRWKYFYKLLTIVRLYRRLDKFALIVSKIHSFFSFVSSMLSRVIVHMNSSKVVYPKR